ncbi:hypothetical protein B9Z55_020055 [Caenorhabditis nigoni]|uniref:Uncharacterized protein n=1 Tax=Caenorhabditis nigoni TaxID=1611254 RepID=A0A2G5TL06_9PELO|nr:hypothetical protein B9Z55_020055 [Caenorhabditis nigoni]
MQPITLFPLVSGFCTGVLPKLFNVTPHVCMSVLAFLVGAQVNSLNLCFLRKHQAIAKISSKYVLNKNTYRAIVFFFLTYTLTYTVPYYLAQYPREYELKMIDKVSCAFGDLHLSVFMQPIGLFPITAGYSNGLLGEYLSVPVDLQMTLLSLLASVQVNLLNICFLKKYKTISNMSSRFEISVVVYNVSVSILGVYPILFSGSFFMASISKEEQMIIIRKDYPFFEQQFLSLKDFQLYVMNFWMSVYFFLAMFGCIQSGLTIGISVLQMVRTLHEVKTLISKATWQKHRVAVRNLVLQFQSSLIGIVPAVSIAFVVVIPSKYSQSMYSDLAFETFNYSPLLLFHYDCCDPFNLQRNCDDDNISRVEETCNVLEETRDFNY